MSKEQDNTATPSSRGRVKKAVGVILYPKYFDPRNWVRDTGYKKGSVISAAWHSCRQIWSPASSSRKETFKQAVKRLGMSEQELSNKERALKISSRSCFLASLAILLFTLVHAYNGNIVGGIAGIFVVAAGIQAGLLRSHRAWQIRERRLGSFAEFLASPAAWII